MKLDIFLIVSSFNFFICYINKLFLWHYKILKNNSLLKKILFIETILPKINYFPVKQG